MRLNKTTGLRSVLSYIEDFVSKMNVEYVFRIILIVGFISIIPVGLHHRLKAHGTGEKLDRFQEGLFILLTLRPIAGIRLAALVAYLIDPELMQWSSVSLPLSLRWAGVLLGIASGVLFVITFRTLGMNLTDTVVTRKNHTLVTHGPYRFVRHPFYVAFTGVVIADSIVTTNWFLALSGLICVALLMLRTRIEEEKLTEYLFACFSHRCFIRNAG